MTTEFSPPEFREDFASFLRGGYAEDILRELGFSQIAEPSKRFPLNPRRGQQALYKVDDDLSWKFVYTGVGDYPWHAVGPAPLSAYNNVLSGGTTSTTYVAVSGVSLELPLAGVYLIYHCHHVADRTSGNWEVVMSSDGPGWSADDNFAGQAGSNNLTTVSSSAVEYERTATTPGTVELHERRLAGAGNSGKETLRATPIRVAP